MLYVHRQKGRKYLTLLFLFFLTTPIFAQLGKELHMPYHDEKPYYFGIILGGTSGRFNADMHSRFLADDSVMTAEPKNNNGLTLGISATQRLNKRFLLRFAPQLSFMSRTFQYQLGYPDMGQTLVTKNIESTIISFPLQLKFESDRIDNFRVYLLGGIRGDIDVASNAQARRAEDMIKIKKYDYAGEVGLGFNFYFPVFILSPEIKISHGLNNIHSRDPNLKYSGVFDKIKSRTIQFTIYIEG